MFRKPNFDKLKLTRDEESLVKLLASGDAKCREQAALALGDIHAKAKTDVLARTLVDDTPTVRAAAIHSLEELEWQPKTSEEKIAWFLARGIPSEAATLQDSDVPLLTMLLWLKKYEWARVVVAQALAYKYDDAAIEALTRMLILERLKEWEKAAQEAERTLVIIGNAAIPKLQEIVNTDREILAQKMFEPYEKKRLSSPMPVPIFVPRPTYHILLGQAERMKQKASEVLKTIVLKKARDNATCNAR
jgi:HEAT repeat protein